MTLVEIAGELEKVTSWIEAQNARERDARTAYEVIRREATTKVNDIKDYAKRLLEHQRRKVTAFGGLLGYSEPAPIGKAPKTRSAGPESKQNLADAICAIWKLERYADPLNTEEIASALGDVGWTSNAAPSSLRSSINQALGKLSKVGRIVRYRSDGTRISIRDTKSRAKKYIAAFKASEVEE